MIAAIRTGLSGTEVVAPEVEIVAESSPERPATLRLGLSNRTDERLAIRSGPPAPFDGMQAEASPVPAHLVPTDEDRQREMSGDGSLLYERDSLANGTEQCWVLSERYSPGQVLVGVYVDPGDTLAFDYALVTEADVRRCFPPGEYRFVSTPSIEGEGSFEWSISVEIEDYGQSYRRARNLRAAGNRRLRAARRKTPFRVNR